jgi:hypothetical protein
MRASIEDRHRDHQEMLRMTEQLVAEFQGAFSARAVVAAVGRCRERLLLSGVRHGLVPATEAAVRAQLSHAVPAHATLS